jgi:hypothetical protein
VAARSRQLALHAHGDREVVGQVAAEVELGGRNEIAAEQAFVALERGAELARGDLEPHALVGRERTHVDRVPERAAELRVLPVGKARVTCHAVVRELAEQEAGLVHAAGLEAVLDLVRVACERARKVDEADVAPARVIRERRGAVAEPAQRGLEPRAIGLGGEILGPQRERERDAQRLDQLAHARPRGVARRFRFSGPCRCGQERSQHQPSHRAHACHRSPPTARTIEPPRVHAACRSAGVMPRCAAQRPGAEGPGVGREWTSGRAG